MGYTYRNNGQIKDFWPDDDENTIYISEEFSLVEIMYIIKNKWPDYESYDITISAEHIHTSCLTYDLHDGNDYTNFTVIRKS